MTVRALATGVQLAVFLCGGILGPVWHLSTHEPGHTHGPEGHAEATRVAPDPWPRATELRPIGEDDGPPQPTHSHGGRRHRHARTATAPSPSSSPDAPRSAGPSSGGTDGASDAEPPEMAQARLPQTPPAPAAPSSAPLSSDHGSASLAHFALALIDAPPPWPISAPTPAGLLPVPAGEAAIGRYRPDFPFPRPPPSNAGTV